MGDDAFNPNYRPTARAPQRGEPRWSFQNDGNTYRAELRHHGTCVGVEAQILRDGHS